MMYYKGEQCGFSFSQYDLSMDENTWTLLFGFGGRNPPPPPGEYRHPYRYCIRAEWRALATCFEWWVDLICVETQWHHRKGVHTRVPRGVVLQYRIHSFRRWPVAVQFFSAER
jgi:hypothetical protein